MDRIDRLKQLASDPAGPDWNGPSVWNAGRQTSQDLGGGYVMQRRTGCVPIITGPDGTLASHSTRETLASDLAGDQTGMKPGSFDAEKRGV